MITFQCSVVRAPQESVSINSPGQWLLTVAIHSPHPGLTDSEHQRGGVECSECVLHLHGRALTGRRMGTPAPLRPVFPGSKQLAQLSLTKGQRIWGQAATLRPLCSVKLSCPLSGIRCNVSAASPFHHRGFRMSPLHRCSQIIFLWAPVSH